jgi:hypothetical protein
MSESFVSTIASAFVSQEKPSSSPKFTLSKNIWEVTAEIDIGIRESKTVGVSWVTPSDYHPTSEKSEVVQEFFAMFGPMNAAEMRRNWCFEFPPRLAVRNMEAFEWEEAATFIREMIKQGILDKS